MEYIAYAIVLLGDKVASNIILKSPRKNFDLNKGNVSIYFLLVSSLLRQPHSSQFHILHQIRF
jgi:hypothetical protein